MKRAALLFFALALLYTGTGLLPGRTFAPLDLPLDADAWKPDPTQRVRVSNTLLGDVVVQFIPWDFEILRLLGEGRAPWVNRFAGENAPLFTNPQTALLSPFTWPRLLFGLDGWAVMALLKIFAAAMCAYWFARELDVPADQALLSGAVYATAGYTIVWLLFPITGVFSLLPGLGAAALRLMKHPDIRNAGLVILFAALCTAGGHPETLFIGVAGMWIFLCWEAERRKGLGIGAMVPSTVGALLGFLLAAVQIVPFLHLVGDSYAEVLRPHVQHPFRVWGLISQILPGILGSPLKGELDLTALPMAENFNLRTGGYVGAVVLLALLLAFRDLAPSLRRGLAIGVVALIASWYPPGVWPLVRNAPVLRVLTFEYFVALFVMFASIAAGPAIAIVAARRRRKIGTLLAAVGIAALIMGLLPLVDAARGPLTRVARSGIEELRERGHLHQAAAVYEERLNYYLSAAGATTARRLAMPGLCWAAAGLALLLPFRRRALLVSIACAAELFVFGVGYNPTVRMTEMPAEPEVITAIRRLDPARQNYIAEHFEVFPANLGTLYGVRDVISYDALNTKESVRRLLPAGYDPVLHTFNPILSPEQVGELGRLGVRFVLSRHEVAGAALVAGPPPPAVGAYQIPSARPVPPSVNRRPAGVIAGAVISLIAALASAAWLRLFLLNPEPAPELLNAAR